MAAPRFIGVLIAILMAVIVMNAGASAGVAKCGPEQHFSIGGHIVHDGSTGAAREDTANQDCCLGFSCFPMTALAEAAVVIPTPSIDLPDPGLSIPLSGRLIPPETGPPKLPA